jgi:hypothetical protein
MLRSGRGRGEDSLSTTPLRCRAPHESWRGPCLASRSSADLLFSLEIPATPRFEICSFGHGKRRREPRKKVAVILAIGHALRAHEALSRSDALSGFLEVVHRLFQDAVFVGHE